MSSIRALVSCGPTAVGLVLTLGLSVTVHAADDWPQWRGPGRNGVTGSAVATSAPPRAVKLDRMWVQPETGRAQSRVRANDGYGSPVIAGGRVYQLTTPVWGEAAGARTIEPGTAEALAKANAKEPNAWPAGVLEQIRAREGKTFENEPELLLWAPTAGLNEKQTAALLAKVPDRVRRPANILFCLDLADGRILWKRELPLPPLARLGWGGHSTPAVAGDLVVALGWDGALFACATDTGQLRWTNSVPRALAARGLTKLRTDRGGYASSPLLAGGLAVVQAGALAAFDLRDGSLRWHQAGIQASNPSPALWSNAGESLVIANGATDTQDRKRRMALAVELRTGEMRWAVPTNENSSPAVQGNLMAMHGATNVCLYRLSAVKADVLGSWPCAVGGSSPVLNDAWLFAGEKEKLAVGIADLREHWRSRGGGNLSSDVLTAEGLLIGAAGIHAAGNGKLLARSPPMLECTSPAVSGNRLVVRAVDGVTCYRMKVSE